MNPPRTVVPPEILIVDDLEEVRRVLSKLLQAEGFAPVVAASGKEALTSIRQRSPDVVLLDVRMPDMDGLTVLTQIKAYDGNLPVIMITGYGSTQDAVRAVKAGAYDYLTKPFNNDDVILTVRRALQERALRCQVRQLREDVQEVIPLSESMGRGSAIQRVVAQVACVAETDFSVLITGETGTGKELVARAIHSGSPRSGKAFVTVDCGAIPESLIESELFGHERGAFTGADRAKAGAFELSSGGTVFLDEIGNLPMPMQGKLLRALEGRRIHRIGSTKTVAVDLRVVAATNADLPTMVEQRAFRRDLYHRLAEFAIQIPPLRERKEDLVFLVKRFLDLTSQELGKSVRSVSGPAWEMIQTYDWPGNVRELRNALRCAVLLTNDHGSIMPEHLRTSDPMAPGHRSGGYADSERPPCDRHVSLKEAVRQALRQVERVLLIQALRQAKGNKAQAARLLEIDYKTIHTKLKGYGIATRVGWDPVSEEAAPAPTNQHGGG